MPAAPIKRSSPLRIIGRREAERINCESLYNTTAKGLGTLDVVIYLQPGNCTQEGVFAAGRPAIEVPRASRMLSEIIPLQFTDAGITVEYVYGRTGFSTEERLTRQTFLMQTLEIWERMLPRMPPASEVAKKSEQDILTAMEILKNTYSIQELLPVETNMEGFRTLFESEMEAPDGSTR